MIEVRNISKKYGTSYALNNVSFSINDNNITGIIGHNGAGKTTLFMIANGLSKPTSGDIFIDNFSLSKNRDCIRLCTGLFTDRLHLYQLLTVKECIDFFKGMYKVSKTRIDYLMESLSLKGFANKKISELSTGMLKRVLLAISIINNPKVLFLDEPFSGLDPESRNDFIHLIKEISNDNIQLLISSHELLELETIIKRLVVLKKGKIVIDDYLDKLMYQYFPNRILEIDIYCSQFQILKNHLQNLNASQSIKFLEKGDNICSLNIDVKDSHLIFSSLPDYARIISVRDYKPSLDDLYFKINEN